MALDFIYNPTLSVNSNGSGSNVNYFSYYIVDRRTGASRRHSMERMELMKLTPDKKGELPTANGGARPKIHKVQKSHSVAADILTPAQSRLEEVFYHILFF